jgi:metacaspase-1
MAWMNVRFIFSPRYPSLMRVHLVIITSDEKIIVDNVRLHLNSSLQRVSYSLTCFQELKRILVDPLPVGCTLLVGNFLFRVCFRILTCCVLQAIIDTCHSGTMLDLPHYYCNDVYVPWQSKGERRTMTMQNING